MKKSTKTKKVVTKKVGISKTKVKKNVNKKEPSKVSNKIIKEKKNKNYNMMLFFTFIVGIVLIVSTYAWFSSTLDASVDFVTVSVNRETGIYISLDGVNYDETITVNKEEVTTNLEDTYPGHNNKWVDSRGLIPISSNGIPDSNTFEFSMFELYRERYSKEERQLYLDFRQYTEDQSGANFVAFDVFIKNISNSDVSDNLYLWEGTSIKLQDGTSDRMVSLLNTVRLGISKSGFTPDKNASGETVQNLECNNNCESFIYEPFSTAHNDLSIERAEDYGVTLEDGVFHPTYAVIAAGDKLSHYSGQGRQPFDNEHFIFQNTFRDLNTRLFELPHGVTKARIYVWLEGQDIDALETKSGGDILEIEIILHKDLAGYGY